MKIGNLSLNPNSNFISDDILKHLITGRTVVLVTSLMKVALLDTCPDFNLVSAKEKYNHRYLIQLVLKNQTCSSKLTNA